MFVNDPELGNGPRDETLMDNFATLAGGKPAAWLWYETFGTKFPKATFDAVSARGYTPVLSWAPSKADHSVISWEKVAAGDVDDLVHDFARSAAAWGKPFYLRPEWEMNLKFDGGENTPDSFVRMWKRLHDIFLRNGAVKVRWFWCPAEEGEWPQTPYASYYPGDAYVDYIGFDAYNWGTTQPWSKWRSPTETYGPTYRALARLTDKPMIIGETGSSELGGDKAAWIRSAFLTDIPQQFPRIIGVLYFSNDQDGSNWRVNTSPESLAAFEAVVASPNYQGRLP